jgi:hypothetical protein
LVRFFLPHFSSLLSNSFWRASFHPTVYNILEHFIFFTAQFKNLQGKGKGSQVDMRRERGRREQNEQDNWGGGGEGKERRGEEERDWEIERY